MIRNGCSTFVRILAFKYSMLIAILFLRGCFFSARTLPGRSALSHSTLVSFNSSRFSAPLITRITRDEFLVAMQQIFQLVQVMFIGGGGHRHMGQATLCIHANGSFHTEVPFIAFLILCMSGSRSFLLFLVELGA